MFRPCHVSAVKVAAIRRVSLKLLERLDAHALSAPLLARLCQLDGFALFTFVDAARNSAARE
jgi:hypothetical protein